MEEFIIPIKDKGYIKLLDETVEFIDGILV